MSESVRANEPDITRKDERCAGVRGCADDLPARGVRVCGCVYTAHHHTVRTPQQNEARCAEHTPRTPDPAGPEHFAAVAHRHFPRLAEDR
jgi:hypothetical protein